MYPFLHYLIFIYHFCLTKILQIKLQNMDPRLYTYEYRRPRLSNPTYSSFNVNSSMTYFMNNPINTSIVVPKKSSYEDSFTLPNNNSNYSQYHQPARQTPNDNIASTPRQRAQSNLSSYGNNSLAFNQRQIYNKQNSKFNIISLKPKQVPDQIKQYPKFTLQDKDQFYYQKMQRMRQQEMNTSRRSGSLPPQQEVIAGKHTFVPEQAKNPSYYQQGRYFTPKMLNHADEVSHVM